jgi:glycolate oxidase FAD binding subunit
MTTATSSDPPSGTRVERPATVSEAARILGESRGQVLFRGAGTKMRWGGRPVQPDLVLETGGMADLLGHNPADMTASVQAGMPLRTLQDRLAEAGQWLALDPPTEAGGATVGGLLATGDSGPRRLRYGALRDLVIGVTLVLPDGTVARAGGQVIKNVAGYDLSKLLYGSLGILGLVAEVVLRVHPRPAASATVVTAAPVDTATATTLELMASPLEPAAVEWTGPVGGDGPGRLAVRFEGSAAGVAAQAGKLRQLGKPSRLSWEQVEEPAEDAVWAEIAAARAADEETVAFAGTLPSQLTAVADALGAAARAAGATATLTSSAALGLHTARLAGPVDAQAVAFDRWRQAVLAGGGTVLLRDRPTAMDEAVDPLGPAPSAVSLVRALKHELDPAGRCGTGRLGRWLDGDLNGDLDGQHEGAGA